MDTVLYHQNSQEGVQQLNGIRIINQIKSTKMTKYGYDKERFPHLKGENFDCLICSCVARDPKECNGCGNMYCSECIGDWLKKNSACPNRCTAAITTLSSKVLIKMYYDLDVKCSYFDKCKKVVKLYDLAKHEEVCQRPVCWNNPICQGFQTPAFSQKISACSPTCVLLKAIMDSGSDQKKIYQQIKKVVDNGKIFALQKATSSSSNNPEKNPSIVVGTAVIGTGNRVGFKWDAARCGQGIEITNPGYSVFLKQQAYVFRTVLGDTPMTGGVHYWEIVADSRTQNQLKIGVSTVRDFDLNSAFCDHPFGFAYYGLGQLRHHSNASGGQFGKRFKKEGVLGVCLNMDKGTLSFALNGQYMGVAFSVESLKTGPIFAAVSLLHCAGCKINTGLSVPNYFKDN